MNKSQFSSHARSLLKVGGGLVIGYAAAHGISKEMVVHYLSGLAASAISAGVGVIWSHFAHSDSDQKQG